MESADIYRYRPEATYGGKIIAEGEIKKYSKQSTGTCLSGEKISPFKKRRKQNSLLRNKWSYSRNT